MEYESPTDYRDITPSPTFAGDGFRVDPIIPLVAVVLVGFIMAAFFSQIKVEAGELETNVGAEPTNLEPDGDSIFLAPYDDYVVTQGLHGFSYGHMAVDLSAGKGTKIKSPINGKVTANYIDNIGNPTLVLENSTYIVTLLHGKYDVSVDMRVKAGQVIGKESNRGNTTDMQGRSCAGRECGYHTHLNVFNKLKNKNVNPLELIGR